MASWNEKRTYLIKLIKRVSDQHGGEDEGELKDYTDAVIKKYASNLDIAIRCFESVLFKDEEICETVSLKSTCALLAPFTEIS